VIPSQAISEEPVFDLPVVDIAAPDPP